MTQRPGAPDGGSAASDGPSRRTSRTARRRSRRGAPRVSASTSAATTCRRPVAELEDVGLGHHVAAEVGDRHPPAPRDLHRGHVSLPRRCGEQVRDPRLVPVPRPPAGREQNRFSCRANHGTDWSCRFHHAASRPPGSQHAERLGDRAVRVGPVERLGVGHQVERSRRPAAARCRHRRRAGPARSTATAAPAAPPHQGRPRSPSPRGRPSRGTRSRSRSRRRTPRTTAAAAPSPTPARRTAGPGSRVGRRRSRPRRVEELAVGHRDRSSPRPARTCRRRRLSRANASPSARSASRSSRFTARRVLTSSTTVPA